MGSPAKRCFKGLLRWPPAHPSCRQHHAPLLRHFTTASDDWGPLLQFMNNYAPVVSPTHIKQLAHRRPEDPAAVVSHVLQAAKDGAYLPPPSAVEDFLETCHVWGLPAKAVEFLSIVRVTTHFVGNNRTYSLLLNRHHPERSLSSSAVQQLLQMAEDDEVELDSFLLSKAAEVFCATNDATALDLLEEVQALGPVSAGLYQRVWAVALHIGEEMYSEMRAAPRHAAVQLKQKLRLHLTRCVDLVQAIYDNGLRVAADDMKNLRHLLSSVQHARTGDLLVLLGKETDGATAMRHQLAEMHSSSSPEKILEIFDQGSKQENTYRMLFRRLGHLRQPGALAGWLDLRHQRIQPTRQSYTLLFHALSRSPSDEEHERIPSLYDDMCVDLKPEEVDGPLMAAVIRAAMLVRDSEQREALVLRLLQDSAHQRLPLLPVTRHLLEESGFKALLSQYHCSSFEDSVITTKPPAWWEDFAAATKQHHD
eukprot:GGOE01014762.1.p1 GENE.GGOE01014762.1~~GGOE01014762.1.p1  ORF type:complete len:479 (+),score=118.76 GGOE01014762.1:60-1496(+)